VAKEAAYVAAGMSGEHRKWRRSIIAYRHHASPVSSIGEIAAASGGASPGLAENRRSLSLQISVGSEEKKYVMAKKYDENGVSICWHIAPASKKENDKRHLAI